jgi:hypothetical protein
MPAKLYMQTTYGWGDKATHIKYTVDLKMELINFSPIPPVLTISFRKGKKCHLKRTGT